MLQTQLIDEQNYFLDDNIEKVISVNNYSEPNNKPVDESVSEVQFLHELRNPLANIEMCVNLLKHPVDSTNTDIYLDIISHSITAIRNVISNRTIIAEPNTDKTSLNKLLDEAVQMIQDRIILRNIKVHKHYADNMSSLQINQQAVKIVFTNILLNAVESVMAEGGILKLTTKTDELKTIVIIEDNGVGIKKDNLKKLFDPFYTSKTSGTGLGLSTTLSVLKANNASVKVDSIENKGTRFIITFNTTG